MEVENGFLFEQCHVQDWDYVKKLYRNSIWNHLGLLCFWCALTIFCAWMAIFNFSSDAVAFGWLYALLVPLCLYRGFLRGWIHLRADFKQSAERYGKDRWEVVARFGDAIDLTEDNEFSFQLEWRCCQQVKEGGDWLCLEGEFAPLYLKKSAFTVGTAEEFQQWLAEVHPEISQSKKRKRKKKEDYHV